jgi:hypothetical protein
MSADEIIRYCHDKGVILTPRQNGRLGFKGSKDVITDELLATLKAHKHEIITLLTIINTFDGRIVSNWREVITAYKPILCPYNNQARYIHGEVCEWHQEEGDPECERVGCKNAKRVH